jgi:hypothetical protein
VGLEQTTNRWHENAHNVDLTCPKKNEDSRSMSDTPHAHDVDPTKEVTSRERFRTFGKIGLLSFGGPAGQIALMHRILVEEKAWLKEKHFCTH